MTMQVPANVQNIIIELNCRSRTKICTYIQDDGNILLFSRYNNKEYRFDYSRDVMRRHYKTTLYNDIYNTSCKYLKS